MLTTTSHDSVLLRINDPLIDMSYITSFTGMTGKWFYKLINGGHFPKPTKLRCSNRQYKSEVEQRVWQRIEESRGAAARNVLQCQRRHCGNQPCPRRWRHSRLSFC